MTSGSVLQLLLSTAVLTLASCSKHEHSPALKATIDVSAPALNQTYRPGDTVRIQAMISSDGTLHGCKLAITNSATGDSLFYAHSHKHAAQLTIDTFWVNTMSQAELLLSISCPLDHHGLDAIKTVNIKAVE